MPGSSVFSQLAAVLARNNITTATTTHLELEAHDQNLTAFLIE